MNTRFTGLHTTSMMVDTLAISRGSRLSPGPRSQAYKVHRSISAPSQQQIKLERQCLNLCDLVGFNIPSADNHTMSYALLQYCLKRLPLSYLGQLEKQNVSLELHAIPYEILEKYHDLLGFVWVERLVWRLHDLNKFHNFRRPELVLAQEHATGRRVAILTIVPGMDYVRHYAAILGVALRTNAPQLDVSNLKCMLYPEITKSIMSWTGLIELSQTVQPGDIVILGFVAELLEIFQNILPSSKVISRQLTPYYGLTRLEVKPGVVISLVGVNYSYWGNLGGIVAAQLATRQPRVVCYVGKQATLRAPSDIHELVFSPTRYCVYDKGKPVWFSDNHPAIPMNPLSSKCPNFDRGLHVSTPTIIEQDVDLRESLDQHSIASMDNELAQMARALTDLHEKSPSVPPVPLLPLMFITDYIRRKDELEMRVAFDLTSRDEKVNNGKRRFFQKCAHLVLETFDILPRPKAVIVGTGYGVKTILPALQRRGVEVVGLCGGGNWEKTDSIARQNNIPVVDCSLAKLQKTQGANLLFVASPHHQHAAMVEEGIKLGFDIVCEKPLALDLPTMDNFIESTKDFSRLTLINHPLRFYEPFRLLKVIAGPVEEIESISVQYFTGRLAKHTAWHECFSKKTGGGMLLAMATHFIDLIEWFSGSQMSSKAITYLKTQNSIPSLPTKDGKKARLPDVESAFQLQGGDEFPTKFSIECDGASDTELFTVTIRSRTGKEYQFVQQKGKSIVMQQRKLPCKEWFPLPIKMEDRVWTSSPWQISFQCFAEKLVESIVMNERERFSRDATDFAGYRRQVEVFGHDAGLF